MSWSMLFTVWQYGFVQRAGITGVVVAALCAVLGLFLVLQRLSLIGDGLSHVSFGAVALGLLLGVLPITVALPVVVLAAIAMQKLMKVTKLYGDSTIGLVSAASIAAGVIIASVAGGFNVDLLSYLFGNILAISPHEMYISLAVAGVVLLIVALLFQDLVAVTFNEEQAKVSGIKTERINQILLIMTAVTVVLSVQVVGVMLISALLIVPAITALQIARGFRRALIIAVVVAVASVVLGILASFLLNWPTGATIVMVSLVFFMASLLGRH